MSLKQKVDRYFEYNTSRKIRAVKFKESKAIFLFKVIPFLLHCNYEDLPGYVADENCPYGVYRFDPEKVMTPELFQRYFPSSSALRKDTKSPYPDKPFIHSLKTIGSIGTIAQTEKSDCDYWVSVRFKEAEEEHLKLLEKKCKAIEEWATTLDHEIYFFLMDIEQTRDNSFESKAEEESAGSALKLLLKDELFRTHILVSGKMPLWWLIPPGLTEDEYHQYVVDLQAKANINLDHFVDLGYISNMPKSEIFGACLWQMNKALDSPFKSVIKFAYLEQLLSSKDQTLNLFSDKIKLLVTFPEQLDNSTPTLQVSNIDPYLLMAKELVAFYEKEKTKKKRDDFIRACLFLKTLEGMESEKNAAESRSHLKSTIERMEEWNLLPKDLRHYLNFQHWKHKDLVEAGAKVHEYLIDTYKRLRWYFRTFEKEQAGLTITEHDIAVLGRKLFTFHEKKPDKIGYINSLSRDIMAQRDITLHVARVEGKDVFFAFQGNHDHKTIKENKDFIIKRERHLIRLLTWLMINGILTAKTDLHLTKNYLPVDLVDIQTLVDKMLETFPTVTFSHISAKQLLEREKMEQALAIINFEKAPVRGAKTLHSTIITINSYGEYFVQDYENMPQYKNALRALLTQHEISRWNKNLEVFIVPQPELHALQSILDS